MQYVLFALTIKCANIGKLLCFYGEWDEETGGRLVRFSYWACCQSDGCMIR